MKLSSQQACGNGTFWNVFSFLFNHGFSCVDRPIKITTMKRAKELNSKLMTCLQCSRYSSLCSQYIFTSLSLQTGLILRHKDAAPSLVWKQTFYSDLKLLCCKIQFWSCLVPFCSHSCNWVCAFKFSSEKFSLILSLLQLQCGMLLLRLLLLDMEIISLRQMPEDLSVLLLHFGVYSLFHFLLLLLQIHLILRNQNYVPSFS